MPSTAQKSETPGLPSGGLWGNVEFKTQYDFAERSVAEFKDVYVGLTNVPFFGRVRVGHQYELMGLEQQTESKFGTFLERGFTSSLIPGRNAGILTRQTVAEGRGTWSLGVFRDSSSSGTAEVGA